MITFKQYMEAVGYRVTEAGSFGWSCYGEHAYFMDAWNGDHDGWCASMVFDTKTQRVYEATVCDYSRGRAYRLIDPEFVSRQRDEAHERGIDGDLAWDDTKWIDLETDDDWLSKTAAIAADQDYDTRVQMPVDFSDEELLKYMKMAHEQDITFNQLIEQALVRAIEAHRKTS